MRSFFLLTIVLCCTVLTSCTTLIKLATGAHKQKNNQTLLKDMVGNGMITKFTVGTSTFLSDPDIFNPQGIARIDDKSFIVATQSPSDSGVVYRYDDTLGIVWQTLYANKNETEPRAWYRNGQIHVISTYRGEEHNDWDTVAYIGRKFNAQTGTLLYSDTLTVVDYNKYYLSHYLVFAADSSALLGIGFRQNNNAVASFYGISSKKRYATQEYGLYVIRPDFTTTSREISVVISPDATDNFVPAFALVGEDVLYNNFHTDASTLYLSVIRLPIAGGKPDTLTVSTPRYTADEDELQPDDAQFTVTPDGKAYIAWNIEDDEEAAYIRLIQCDFQARTARIFTDIAFTEQTNEQRFNSYSFDEPRIMGCYPLTDGGLLILFDECKEKTKTVGGTGPGIDGNFSSVGGRDVTYYLAEWLGVACINSDGSTRWLRTVPRKQASYTSTPLLCSFRQENSIGHTFLLDDNLFTNITFSLADGRDNKVPFPINEINSSSTFPASALWNNDSTIVFPFNANSEEAYIGRMRIPEINTGRKEK